MLLESELANRDTPSTPAIGSYTSFSSAAVRALMTELNIMFIPTLLKVALMGTLVGCGVELGVMLIVIAGVGFTDILMEELG